MSREIFRPLAGKIAGQLTKRVGQTDNTKLAQEDLSRIRRLIADGQINESVLTNVLDAISTNEALENDFRTTAKQELEHIESARAKAGLDIKPNAKMPYKSETTIVPASFPVPTLVKTGWTPVTGTESTDFLAQISPVDGKIRVASDTTHVHWRLMPWYDEVALLRVYDPTWDDQDRVLYYLTLSGNLFRLNGTSPPIHEVNAKAPIKITTENALDYLKFFCFFVRGEEGPFYVLEDDKDPFFPDIADDVVKTKFLETIKKAEPKDMKDDGKIPIDATVFYSNAIFQAQFDVHPTGMIEMIDDNPILADLPVRVHAPLT